MSTVKPPSPPVIGGVPAKHSGTDNHPPRRVVIHSAVTPCKPGMARLLGEMNRDGTTGGSWHYSVDPESTFQCSFDRFVCWHAPPNSNSLGIEMADTPGPVPHDPPGTAAWKAAKRVWRWRRPEQRAMLRRTAVLTARLLLAYDLPVRYVGARGLRAGKRGVTTHAAVSQTWGQSTHWDPGFWPRRWFMHMVRAEARRLTKERK